MNDKRPAGNPKRARLAGNRDFFLLWSGNGVSLIGFHGARIAYPLLVLAMTDSLVMAGWVGFALGAPSLLLLLPAGVVADRFARLRILLCCQVAGLLIAGPLAIAVLLDASLPALVIIAAAFAEGTVFVLVDVCELGAVDDVLTPGQRPAAVAFLEAEQPIALLLGRAVGGAIYDLARWLPFLVDALTSLYCLAAVAAIRPRPDRASAIAAQPATRPQLRDIGAGIRVVWRDPLLRASTATIGLSNLIIQVVLLMILFELREAGYPAWIIGIVLSAAGIGGILGSLVASRLGTRVSAKSVYRAAFWVWTALLVPMTVSDHPAVLAVCWGGVGAIGVISNVSLTLYRVTVIPERTLGRAMAAVRLASNGAVAVGALAAGYLLATFGSEAVARWNAAAMFVLALCAGNVFRYRKKTLPRPRFLQSRKEGPTPYPAQISATQYVDDDSHRQNEAEVKN